MQYIQFGKTAELNKKVKLTDVQKPRLWKLNMYLTKIINDIKS